MADIIIRTARKQFVCDCCGHIIREGEEYLDKIILHDGRRVRHERYHDECPYSDDSKEHQFLQKFFSQKELIAEHVLTHEKYHITGITSGADKMVELLDWDFHKVPDVPIKTFLEVYKYE